MTHDPRERNIERLLAEGHEPVQPDPAFGERLLTSLRQEAARLRQADSGAPAPARPRRWWRAAAAALIGGVLVYGVGSWRSEGSPRGGPVPPGPWWTAAGDEATLVLAGNQPAHVASAPGTSGLVRLGSIARIELRDGAQVSFVPGFPASLTVEAGYARLHCDEPMVVAAADVELQAAPASDCEIEVLKSGDPSMSKPWLIPSGAFVGGAVLVGIVMHYGKFDVTTPTETRPIVQTAPAEPLVLQRPESRANRPTETELWSERERRVAAERRLSDLEKKVAALKKENDKLNSELVQKKGVTIGSVMARLAEFRKGNLLALLAPARLSELVSDLKGLGPEGVAAMTELLKSPDSKERMFAARVMEDLGDPTTIPSLREAALNDTDEMVAKLASHALALMDAPGSLGALREIADQDRSWESKVNSLWGLCKYGDARGLEQSLAYLKDTKVSDSARAALGANLMLLNDERLMPIVDSTIEQYGKHEQVMSLAVDYFKNLGTVVARERLRAIAQNPTYSAAVRKAAEDALR